MPYGENVFLKVFTIYGHGRSLGHVIKIIFITLCLLHIKFGFDWLSGFRKETAFENNGHIRGNNTNLPRIDDHCVALATGSKKCLEQNR